MDDDDVLLNAQQTRARVGSVSAMCIWRWIRDDRVKFPPPIKINRRNCWRLAHDSPHFHMTPKVPAKIGNSASIAANRSIKGSSRASGMVGMRS